MDVMNCKISDMALSEYTKHRAVDAKAMCDLALYNYIEVNIFLGGWLYLNTAKAHMCERKNKNERRRRRTNAFVKLLKNRQEPQFCCLSVFLSSKRFHY